MAHGVEKGEEQGRPNGIAEVREPHDISEDEDAHQQSDGTKQNSLNPQAMQKNQ